MKVGDLVTMKRHRNHLGIVTNLGSDGGEAWITIKWFVGEIEMFRFPTELANHFEVIQ